MRLLSMALVLRSICARYALCIILLIAGVGIQLGTAHAQDDARYRIGAELRTVEGGVEVVATTPGAPAEGKIKPGDIVREVSQAPVAGPEQVQEAIQRAGREGRKSVLFLVERENQVFFVALRIDRYEETTSSEAPIDSTPKAASDVKDQYTPDDLGRAVQFLKKRAASGDPDAEFGLALYLRTAAPTLEGQEADYERIRDLYKRAASQGHVRAAYALGRMYDEGVGVDEDITQAAKFYEIAAEADHIDAIAHLGAIRLLQSIETGTLDLNKRNLALELSRYAAKSHPHGPHPIALNTLGVMYHQGFLTGDFFHIGYEKAFEHFTQAAELGDCEAMMNVGGMYFNGDHVEQNAKRAREWFDRAEACAAAEDRDISQMVDTLKADIAEGRLPSPRIYEGMEPTLRRSDGKTEVVMALGMLMAIGIANSSGAAQQDCYRNIVQVCSSGPMQGVDLAVTGVQAGMW